ncbi:MAG: biotin--[acetyl-CoA-carboxylase] ligase [Gammaproteobacteria bacterium]|nr:biotin--[acetyl-CoA-carboxylase] ligase [Gammaproteobacteria bacterium]
MKKNDQNNPLFERLDESKILSFVSKENLCYLSALDIFDSIPSTNQFLLEQAKTSPSGHFCLAEQQTAGRGRRGRVWDTPLGGNIACSLLWRFKNNISGLSNAVGVILVNVLRQYGIKEGLQLKWPNDVLFAQRKLAGILIEKIGESVIIGIGVNLHLPEPKLKERIDVNEIMNKAVARNELVGLLINELLKALPLFQQQGLKGFIKEWRKWDGLTGCKVNVLTPERVFCGIAQGINEKGEFLLLDQEQKIHVFQYGEVTVRQNPNSFLS